VKDGYSDGCQQCVAHVFGQSFAMLLWLDAGRWSRCQWQHTLASKKPAFIATYYHSHAFDVAHVWYEFFLFVLKSMPKILGVINRQNVVDMSCQKAAMMCWNLTEKKLHLDRLLKIGVV
jgi:hypothetical protein